MDMRSSIVQLARRVTKRRVASHLPFRSAVEGKSGLEIGGPSPIFADAGILPLYRYVTGLDNCAFSLDTIWEGRRLEGETFVYHDQKSNGFNFIREASDLYGIADQKYDFLLASHSLEHLANPVKALKEWMRVLKQGAALIIFLPDYRRTFDHRRKPTSVAHMQEDYALRRDEGDQTHVPEILELHDLARDPGAGSKDEFYRRSLRNVENRCLHHHVFDEINSRELLQSVGLTVELVELVNPLHIAILARFLRAS